MIHATRSKTSEKGSIQVAIRRGDGEFDGKWLPDWDFDQSLPFTGDSANQPLAFTEVSKLDSLKGQTVRLQFRLEQAHLYSFWFD